MTRLGTERCAVDDCNAEILPGEGRLTIANQEGKLVVICVKCAEEAFLKIMQEVKPN